MFLAIIKHCGGSMQDYASWYPSRFRKKAKDSKLYQIRKLLMSGLPAEVLLLLIAAVVLPGDMLSAIKR
jgi:hypothetical protein